MGGGRGRPAKYVAPVVRQQPTPDKGRRTIHFVQGVEVTSQEGITRIEGRAPANEHEKEHMREESFISSPFDTAYLKEKMDRLNQAARQKTNAGTKKNTAELDIKEVTKRQKHSNAARKSVALRLLFDGDAVTVKKTQQRSTERAQREPEVVEKDKLARSAARAKRRAAGEQAQFMVKARLSGQTEAERIEERQTIAGSRYQQDQATRVRDEAMRRYRQRHPEKGTPPARAAWPPPAPTHDDPHGPSPPARLDSFIGLLDHGLRGRIHTCPNCKQRDVCHGVPAVGQTTQNGEVVTSDSRAAMKCWRCETKLGNTLHWSNGLDLNLDCNEEEATGTATSEVPLHSRQAWRKLQQDWGDLTPLEEALVSRVAACTSVLRLPSDGQLGYKSSVINYINDTASVVQKLPRAPKDSNFVIYEVANAEGGTELRQVRKHAVRAYLEFFATHHPFYRDGIRDPNDASRYIVRPFDMAHDFDYDEWNSWAEEFVADLNVLQERKQEQPTTTGSATDLDADADTDADATNTPEGKLGIPTAVLVQWLRMATDPAVQSLRARVEADGLDVSSRDDVERLLRDLFDTDATSVRADVITVGTLATRLAQRYEIGEVDINVAMINASVHDLVKTLYGDGANTNHSGCPHVGVDNGGDVDPAQRRANNLKAQLGTPTAPFVQQLENDRIPVNEFVSHGYETLAFPTLFPFGRGFFSQQRAHELSYSQYSQHLSRYYDGRFAQHGRFPYFLLNTHERQLANDKAGIAVLEENDKATVGDLRNMSRKDKKEVAHKISKYSSELRNSPGFFDRRKKELRAMCEQLGDPHAFATNSHADTYCPYLARFIMDWVGVPNGGPLDPFAAGLSKQQRYQRRQALMVKHPHLAAYFFHLKTELYLEHICVGIMGANAWWSRYEWQSRGSTHAHYFLWFHDAPDVSFLEDWFQQEVAEQLSAGGGKVQLDEDALDDLVDALNARALAAAVDSENEQDRLAAAASEYWTTRCSRWNTAWLDEQSEPDTVGEPHPCEAVHQRATPAESTSLGNEMQDLAPSAHGVSAGANRWMGRLLNATNRHTTHTDYCLRKDKHGKPFCRFHFPQECRLCNDRAYFYCERFKKGVRWRLYLPMNDPLRNTVNHWQALACRGNIDFQPLVDHFSALEYVTKYASKAEKGSGAFDAVLSSVLERSEEQLPNDATVKRVYAAVLSQVVGGRNWSAQEVAHVNMGCKTVVCSHKFETIYLAGKKKRLRVDITPNTADDEPAFQPNFLDKYLKRLESCATSQGVHDVDQDELEAHGFTSSIDPYKVDLDHVARCSFTEFWRTYKTTADGPKKRTFKVRSSPPPATSPPSKPCSDFDVVADG